MAKENENLIRVIGESVEQTDLVASLEQQFQIWQNLPSGKRTDARNEFIEAIQTDPLATIELVKLMAQFPDLKKTYVGQSTLQLLTKKGAVERAVRNNRVIPSYELFQSVMGHIGTESDVAERMVGTFLSLPSQLYTEQEANGQVNWQEVLDASEQISGSILLCMENTELSDQQKAKLMMLWKQEAFRMSVAPNLLAILTFGATNEEFRDKQDVYAAAGDTLVSFEAHLLGMDKRQVDQRMAMNMQVLAKKHKWQIRYSPFMQGWVNRASEINRFRQDPEEASTFSVILPHQHWIVNYGNRVHATTVAGEMSQVLGYPAETILLPDGGCVLMMHKSDKDRDHNKPILAKDLVAVYGKLYEHQSANVQRELEFQSWLLTTMVPELDVHLLEGSLAENKAKASGGLSTISTRGDRIELRPDQYPDDAYLTNLGISGITYWQENDGILATIIWHNFPIRLKVDKDYTVQGLDQLNHSQRLWMENLVLGYIGGIKQKLVSTFSTEKVVQGGTRTREHKGKRAHLRVLPLGQESTRVDFQDPDSIAHEREFMLNNYGVTLFTLNSLLALVQDDVRTARPTQFEDWMDLHEKQLPQHLKKTRSTEAVRAIIFEAMKRTVQRDYQVRYSKVGLGIKQGDDLAFELTKNRFQMTLVHESKPGEAIQVEPMVFVCPQVSAGIKQLADSV